MNQLGKHCSWRKASHYKFVVSGLIPRFWFLIYVVFLLAQPCAAHFLNMTRAELVVDPVKGELSLSLQVDFTRMLAGGEAYYELTQSDPANIAATQAELVGRLTKDLVVLVDGEKLDLELKDFQLPDLPLEKFTETWAAPMTDVSLFGALPEGTHTITVKTNAWLQIEFPFVLTMQELGTDQRPVTRWLEPGQSSPKLAYQYLPIEVSSTEVLGDDPGVIEPIIEEDSGLSILWRYVVLGYMHILPKGLDHILFIIGLFFLSHRWRPLLQQVSLFTLAHTITLGLTALGYLPYVPGVVEPLIALSIAYVGIENLFVRRLHWSRLIVVFVFGLIHGMGFAGMLQSIGLPAGEFLLALLSFNFGVEVGQVTILCVLWCLLYRFFNRRFYRGWLQVPASLVISIIAGYWFF